MSVYISAHMTSYPRGDKAEKRYPELKVKLTHCVADEENTAKYVPEATAYERLKLTCDSEGFDIVVFLQAEHLWTLHAALSEFLAKHPDYVERGNNPISYAEDIARSSRDLAMKAQEPEVESAEKEQAE
jgi:hypothetical protein